MARNQLPPEVLEFFRRQGSKGGKLGGSVGGKKAAQNMTPEQRSARAKKASAVAVNVRKANKKPKT